MISPARLKSPRPQKIMPFAELCFDCGDNAHIQRFNRGRTGGGNMAVAAGEIFMETPVRRIERLFERRPFAEWMRA
ncbi:MAG TPA: hypothetical protein VKT73_02460 [Xanthobacteraceae bacterium]|nr:hypothetical protein [Xanthobacteraceae bacterium]